MGAPRRRQPQSGRLAGPRRRRRLGGVTIRLVPTTRCRSSTPASRPEGTPSGCRSGYRGVGGPAGPPRQPDALARARMPPLRRRDGVGLLLDAALGTGVWGCGCRRQPGCPRARRAHAHAWRRPDEATPYACAPPTPATTLTAAGGGAAPGTVHPIPYHARMHGAPTRGEGSLWTTSGGIFSTRRCTSGIRCLPPDRRRRLRYGWVREDLESMSRAGRRPRIGRRRATSARPSHPALSGQLGNRPA